MTGNGSIEACLALFGTLRLLSEVCWQYMIVYFVEMTYDVNSCAKNKYMNNQMPQKHINVFHGTLEKSSMYCSICIQ